jgi:hypothetical protein
LIADAYVRLHDLNVCIEHAQECLFVVHAFKIETTKSKLQNRNFKIETSSWRRRNKNPDLSPAQSHRYDAIRCQQKADFFSIQKIRVSRVRT